MSEQPPRWAYRLLRHSLPPTSAGETILGDLHEEYLARRPGVLRNVRYVGAALRLAAEYRLARRRTPKLGALGDGFRQDLRQAARALLREPGYLTLAVLTLAVGIGAATAAFSIIYGSLVQPLPYHEPDRLLRIYRWYKQFPPTSHNSMSAANFLDLRDHSESFEGFAGYQNRSFNISATAAEAASDAPPVRVAGLRADPALFAVLGVTPQLGRPLTSADAEAGAEPVVVISDTLWRSRFDGDPHILGREIRIDLVARTVVGVLPPSFAFVRQPQVIVPVDLAPPEFHRGVRNIDGLARLAPGVTPEAGLAELQAIYADLEQQYPDVNAGWSVAGVVEQEWRVRRRRAQLWMFGGAVLVVLLIACVNVAGLTLVRVESRRHDLGVRAALGAGRWRLARLLLTESLMVSLAGGALGALLCYWLVDLALVTYAGSIPRPEEVTVDVRSVGFAVALALATGLLVALAPVVQLRSARGLRRALQGGGRPAAAAAPLRHALVVVELALAVILVTGAGLMIDTVGRLHRVDLGVETDGVLTFALGLPQARYGTPAEITAFWDRFVEELEGIPGVEAAGLTSRQPLVGGTNGTMVLSSEPDIEPTAETLVEIRTVSPGYFDAVGIQLTRGRMLGPADRGAGGGVLINEAFVRRRLGDDDPLRESLRPLWLEQSWPIVGVVSDSREFGPTEPARPTAYWLIGTEAMGIRSYMYAALRTSGSPTAVVPQVRERLSALDRDIPVVDIATLDEIADQRVGRNRQSALSLLSVFAGVALLLAAIGTYGVVSFSVGMRAREIGVRMALGSTAGGVARLVLRQGLWIAALGIAAGTLASLLTGRLLVSMLWQASPTDPMVLLGVAAVLLATALLACWLPARRAARLEVVDILRRD